MTLSQNAVVLSFPLEVSVCSLHARQILNCRTSREVWHFIFKRNIGIFPNSVYEKKKNSLK